MCKEISTIIQKFPARLQSTSNMPSRVGILAKKKKMKNDEARIADWPCRPKLFWEKKREEKTFSRSHKIWIGVCYPRSYTVKILPCFKGEMNKN